MSEKTYFSSTEQIRHSMKSCSICPRHCHVNRLAGEKGFCGQTAQLSIARAALHFWEEPCISGTRGSGTVFFSGCNLRCVYCQNASIALGQCGLPISLKRLTEIFMELQDMGAHNINLVTPTHYVPHIIYALQQAKARGLSLPIVYNTSGYEEVETLRLLEGLVDIYMPDLKYLSTVLSGRYSHAEDYFAKASAALDEMLRQTGGPRFDTQTGLMQRGVLVRHLILPGNTKDSKKILRYLHEHHRNDIYVSIMNQYTPLSQVEQIPELNRRITEEEYNRVLSFADAIGIEQGFVQEGETARESFIPSFDYEGVMAPSHKSTEII